MLQLMEEMGGVGGGRRGSPAVGFSAATRQCLQWSSGGGNAFSFLSVRVNLREWFFGYFIRPIISSVSISSTFQLWKIKFLARLVLV